MDQGMTGVGMILGSMAAIAVIEAAIQLHARGRWSRRHLGPKLTPTFITFATNLVFNALLVIGLVQLQATRSGLLPSLPLSPFVAAVVGIVALDFSFYLAHVLMHALPAFWRFHSVHHSDPAVDVTTTV